MTARATGPSPVFDQVGSQIGVDPTTDPTNSGRSTLSITINNESTGVAGVTGYGLHIKPVQSNSPDNKNQGISLSERDDVEISRFREIAFTSDYGWGSTNPICQNTTISVWGSVTGSGIIELRTDRGGTAENYNKIFVRPESIMSSNVKLQIFKSATENADIEIKCKIKQISSVVSLASNPTIIVNDNSIPAFNPSTDVIVSIDSSYDALKIELVCPSTSYAFGKVELVDLGIPI